MATPSPIELLWDHSKGEKFLRYKLFHQITQNLRLKRVFNVDIETCNECGGAVKVIAYIEDPSVIENYFWFLTGSNRVFIFLIRCVNLLPFVQQAVSQWRTQQIICHYPMLPVSEVAGC